jgi:hypothetical protein
MKTVPIPGGTADLREQTEIKVRHRRLVESASVGAATALAKLPSEQAELEAATLAELALTEAEADNLFRLQDATIVAALDSWTLPDPLPTLATVGDLAPEVYDALAEATRDLGTAIAAKEDFEPSNPADPSFNATPTPPSSGSEEHLRADPDPASTTAPLSTTKSGAFEGPFTD